VGGEVAQGAGGIHLEALGVELPAAVGARGEGLRVAVELLRVELVDVRRGPLCRGGSGRDPPKGRRR